MTREEQVSCTTTDSGITTRTFAVYDDYGHILEYVTRIDTAPSEEA